MIPCHPRQNEARGIIFVCPTRFSFNKMSGVVWGSPIRKDRAGLRAGGLSPNWKSKLVEVGKWNAARFPPTQFC